MKSKTPLWLTIETEMNGSRMSQYVAAIVTETITEELVLQNVNMSTDCKLVPRD